MSDGTKLKRPHALHYLNEWKGRVEAYTRANGWTGEPMDYEMFLTIFRMNPETALWRLGPDGSNAHIATLGVDNYWNIIVEEPREPDPEEEAAGEIPPQGKHGKIRHKSTARKGMEALATVVYPSMRARSAVRAGIVGMDWVEEKIMGGEKPGGPSEKKVWSTAIMAYFLLLLLVVWFGGCVAYVNALFGG